MALEPFRQIDSPLSRKVEGTGLGLSLVKTLAELHDGTLEIASKPDVGTEVSVRFQCVAYGQRKNTNGCGLKSSISKNWITRTSRVMTEFDW